MHFPACCAATRSKVPTIRRCVVARRSFFFSRGCLRVRRIPEIESHSWQDQRSLPSTDAWWHGNTEKRSTTCYSMHEEVAANGRFRREEGLTTRHRSPGIGRCPGVSRAPSALPTGAVCPHPVSADFDCGNKWLAPLASVYQRARKWIAPIHPAQRGEGSAHARNVCETAYKICSATTAASQNHRPP